VEANLVGLLTSVIDNACAASILFSLCAHCGPVNLESIARSANTHAGLGRFLGVHDLNFHKRKILETKGFT
jgi:hypothetical protein